MPQPVTVHRSSPSAASSPCSRAAVKPSASCTVIRPAKRIGRKGIACKPAEYACAQRVKHGELCTASTPRRVQYGSPAPSGHTAPPSAAHRSRVSRRGASPSACSHDFTLFRTSEKRLIAERPVKIKQPRLGRDERGCHPALLAVDRKGGFEQPRHMAFAAMRRVGARAVNIGDFPLDRRRCAADTAASAPSRTACPAPRSAAPCRSQRSAQKNSR